MQWHRYRGPTRLPFADASSEPNLRYVLDWGDARWPEQGCSHQATIPRREEDLQSPLKASAVHATPAARLSAPGIWPC